MAVAFAGPVEVEAANRAEVVLSWFVPRLIAARADAPAVEADTWGFETAGVATEEQVWSFGNRC